MTVRIGINPLTWSNDDLPAVGADISLETCLTEASAVGYAGVELGRKFPRRAHELKPLLDAHGLELVSGWHSGALLERSAAEELAALQAHLDLLRAMGCKVVVFAETTGCIHGDRRAPLSRRPCLAPGAWRSFAQRLTELAVRVADTSGIELAFHHHMGTVVQSTDDIERLMEATGDAVRLLLDTGHLSYALGDPVGLARDYGARIAHVHCKDVRSDVLAASLNRDLSFLDAVLDGVFTVPGDGCVDYPGMFAELRRHAYSGWWVVEAEQDPTVAPPLRFARMGYEYLRAQAEDYVSAGQGHGRLAGAATRKPA